MKNSLIVLLIIGCLFASKTFASDDTPTSTITESESDSIEYDIVGVVVACITIVGGILLLGFGQRLFKLALALVGLLVVGLAIGTLVNKILLDQGNNLHYVWATVAGVGAGAIAAIILYCMFVIGLLLLGICVGAGLGFVVIALIGAPVLNIAWLSWLIVCVLAAVVGVAFVLLRKRVLILGTSILGGYCVVLGVDYFSDQERVFNPATLYSFIEQRQAGETVDVPLVAYILAGVWVFLAIVGILVQTFVTKKNHEEKRDVKYKPIFDEESMNKF